MPPISREDILEMQLRNERRRQRKAEREQPGKEGLLMAALQTEPVQRFLEAPRQAIVEGIQRYAEASETGVPEASRGPWGGPLQGGDAWWTHMVRELASDVLDVAADIPYSPIPEEWGERIDPSQDTEIGARVLAEKEARMRERGGEPLSWAEQYDIMAEVQDEAMPWLKKRWGPGGFVSTRGLMEVGGEVGVGVASLVIPGAAAAKFGALGARVASVSGRAAPVVKATTRATQELIQIPRRIEQLGDAIVGKPLGFALRWGVRKPIAATGRVSMASLRVLMNRFKNRALAEGLPPDLVAQKQVDMAQEAVNTGKVSDKSVGQEVTARELRDPSDKPPVVSPAEKNILDIDAIPIPSARTGGPSWHEIGADLLRAGKNQVISLIPGTRAPVGNFALRRLGRDAKRNITHWWDRTQNRIEGRSSIRSRYVELYVDILKKAGVLRPMGRMTDSMADSLDRNVDSQLADGSTWASVVKFSNDGNFTFTDDWFRKNPHNLSPAEATFTGHTKKTDAIGNVVVDKDLLPGFTDVIEHKNYYSKQLNAIKLDMPEGGKRTAWELVEDLSAWGNEIDIQNRTLGRVRGGGAMGLDAGVGDTYFPRGGEVSGLPGSDVGLSVMPKRTLGRRQYISQADGMADGVIYFHPAEAIRLEYRNMGEAIRDQRYADFVKGLAEENGLNFGTVNDLMARSPYFRNYMETIANMRKAVQSRLSRLTDVQRYTSEWQPATPPTKFRLPKDLRGAAPRWRYYELAFESDIDKAFYIVAQVKRSKADFQYMAWLRTFPHLLKQTDAELRATGGRVREHIRGTVSGKDPGQVVIHPSAASLEVTKAKSVPGSFKKKSSPGVKAAEQFLEDTNAIKLEQILALDGAADAFVKQFPTNYFKWKASLDIFRDGLVPRSEKEFFNKRMGAIKVSGEKATDEVIKDLQAWPTGFGPAPTDLGGHYFPWEFYDEVGKAFRDLVGVEGGLLKGIERQVFMVQTMVRQMGATADLSAPGIQGLVHLWYDAFRLTAGQVSLRLRARLPGEAGRMARAELTVQPKGNAFIAMRAMVRAGFNSDEGGRRVTNEMLYLFDATAVREGGLTSVDWARLGGAFRERAVDYTLGSRSRGIAGTLGNLPGLKQAERMFNFYGNQLRLFSMNRELLIMRAQTGKTAQQLADDGSAASIASVMNAMTGVGRRGFAGNFGQFLFFAPSFFNARLRVMGQMMRGTPIERRMARQYMVTYLGTATTVTFAINEAFGEETDISPFTFDEVTGKWRFNPNFMRIKVGSLNISLFGPWDTMLRLAALPFVAAANQREGLDFGQVLRDLRGSLSAPISNVSLDIITGEDAIGRKSRPAFTKEQIEAGRPSIIDWLLDYTMPFAWGDVLMPEPGGRSLVERFREGTAGERVEVVAQLGLQAVGGKSSYETPYESMNRAFAEVMELGPQDPNIQEMTGVTQGLTSQADLEAFYAEYGSGPFSDAGGRNYQFSLRHMFKDRTPPFGDIARDIQNNMKRMLKQGRFKEIMTAEEYESFEKRMNEKLIFSARAYDNYRLERDAIIDKENAFLTKMVAAFEEGKPEFEGLNILNPEALLKAISQQRGMYSRKKADLTAEGGKYEEVHDLFSYANETALGNLSSSDADLYDTAQALYFETLWGDEKLYNKDTLKMDWDLFEERVKEWGKAMEKQFPGLTPTDVQYLRYRVQLDDEEGVPPLVGALLKASKYLVGQNWYEHLEGAKAFYENRYPEAADTIKKYGLEDNRSKEQMRKTQPWLVRAYQLGVAYRLNLRRGSDRIDGIAVLLDKTINPVSLRGQQVKAVLNYDDDGTKKIDDWLDFISAVHKGDSLDRFLGGVRVIS